MARTSIAPLLVLSLCLAGCTSHQSGNESSASAAQTAASGMKLRAMSDGSRDVLRVAVPADADCDTYVGRIFVGTRGGKVNIWLVAGAKTVEEAVKAVPQKIDSEFKELKVTSTKSLSIRGEQTPATRLMGSGVEADDFDPGTADAIVFRRGGHVFIALTHGEALHDSAQALMLSLVESSTAP